ncbi:hypothetical protein BSMD_029620 [Bacillus subtilis Miyagi-4]|nr:hypothetical protein BSMD_029620 [Bacillus subtilis Miyagi-4]
MNYVTHSAFFTKCSHKGEGRLSSGRTLGSLAAFHSKIKKNRLYLRTGLGVFIL